MSPKPDYMPYLLLGGGAIMLALASRPKKRVLEDRSGEKCNPEEIAPPGYQCGQVLGGWKLRHEPEHFTGYGPYINRESVDAALERLGFSDGNLSGFQKYMSAMYDRDIRTDGAVDGASMDALKDAELMMGRDEWAFPRGMG